MTLVAGCSYATKPIVLGVQNDAEATVVSPIELSSVIYALKWQLGTALLEIKGEFKNDEYASEALWPKLGAGTLSGTTQVVSTDNGNILAIIPVTGYAGSTATPNFSATRSATNIQTIAIQFSFDPDVDSSNLVAEPLSLSDTDSLFIKEAIVETFKMLADTANKAQRGGVYPPAPEQPAHPKITNRQVDFEFTFSVVQNNSAGLGFTIVPSGPDVNSITSAPALGVAKNTTGTYKLTLSLPLVTPQVNDPRRIIQGAITEKGQVILIDKPYTVEDAEAGAETVKGVARPDGKFPLKEDGSEESGIQYELETPY